MKFADELNFLLELFFLLRKRRRCRNQAPSESPPATKKFPFTQSVHRIPLDVDTDDVDLVDYLVEKISILKLSWPRQSDSAATSLLQGDKTNSLVCSFLILLD